MAICVETSAGDDPPAYDCSPLAGAERGSVGILGRGKPAPSPPKRSNDANAAPRHEDGTR